MLLAAGLALYWPTLKLDFHLLDEPGDTLYSFKLVEKLVANPSLKALQSEKDFYRLTPIHYLYHYAVSRAVGLNGPRHHAAHLCFLAVHLLLLVWLFRKLTGTGWWAFVAGFLFLLFIPDDWNSTPYNYYTLFTLEPLVLAFLGGWCGVAAWLALSGDSIDRRAILLRRALLVSLFPWALLVLFTKETALFYSPGVAVLGLVLWRRSRQWRVPLLVVSAYAIASVIFLGCFFYVTGWKPGVSKEVMPDSTPYTRMWQVAHAFVDTFGPLLLLIPVTYVLCAWNNRADTRRDWYFGVDVVCAAMLLPSLAQLIIWPNFQVRLLYPHGFLVSIVMAVTVWRLVVLMRAHRHPAQAWIARILLSAGFACCMLYALFAMMALHNFRLLLRCNELSRVHAYHKCRELLEPDSRLFVAIMRGDQVFAEIGWRLSFFDKMNNPVIELQPGSEQPLPGDVIYYQERMARVKRPRLPMDAYVFEESGDAYLHTGWRKWIAALRQGKPPLETAHGGNEYTVFKVQPAR